MTPYDVLDRASAVRDVVVGTPKISVTDLSRSKDWRSRLPEVGVMEITDRGDTAGWLVSDADMNALIEGYTYLEEELEKAQIAAMFAAREDARPVSGEALEREALASFEARKANLAVVVNGG